LNASIMASLSGDIGAPGASAGAASSLAAAKASETSDTFTPADAAKHAPTEAEPNHRTASRRVIVCAFIPVVRCDFVEELEHVDALVKQTVAGAFNSLPEPLVRPEPISERFRAFQTQRKTSHVSLPYGRVAESRNKTNERRNVE